MPSCVNSLNKGALLLLLLPGLITAGGIGARIISVDVQKTQAAYVLNAHVDYALSPTAKQAIYKGVPLSWVVRIKIQKPVLFWYFTVKELRIPFVIQYQALLNQYSVKNIANGRLEMFVGLNSALNYMEQLKNVALPAFTEENDDQSYRLAIKIQFDREFLPIPLRPESYFDSQWSLSSDWLIWLPHE